MTDAIVIGGSRGIGRAISDALASIGVNVTATSRKDIDTSNRASVSEFTKNHTNTDILILNTGGPEPKRFEDVTIQDWDKYHNQLFVGFCTILQNIRINDGGYIFLISSMAVKEPVPNLVISSAYRAAFSEVFKIQSKEYAKRDISCINIAPGPFDTDRMRELAPDIDKLRSKLPMGRLGKPEEIGNFIKSVVQNEIKYLSGCMIPFDGAASNYTF